MTGKWNMKRVDGCVFFSSITDKGFRTDKNHIHGKHSILLNGDRHERYPTSQT